MADRERQPALILDLDQHWAAKITPCLRSGPLFIGVEQHTNATLQQVRELARRPWGLTIMGVFAAVDQKRPLEALALWQEVAPDTPVLVVSDLPSSEEARDAMGLGATYYSPRPYTCAKLKLPLLETLQRHIELHKNPEGLRVAEARRKNYLEQFRGSST